MEIPTGLVLASALGLQVCIENIVYLVRCVHIASMMCFRNRSLRNLRMGLEVGVLEQPPEVQ